MAVSYSARWQHGDTVSQVIGGCERVGKVVQLRRKSDHAPFLMVQITGGAGILGKREWPDGWALGVGPYLHRCLGCRQEYRSSDHEEDMCPACLRAERQNMHPADETRSVQGSLYGASTPIRSALAATDEDIVALKAQDERESPY